MDKFVRCSVLRISREHNSQADALAKLASSSELKLPRTVTIFRLLESSITEESVVHAVIPEYGTDGDTWMTPIMKFLQDGALPEEKSASLRVRRQSPRYLLINRVLYRRGYSLPYLRCIAPPQTDLVLQEVHGGTCVHSSLLREHISLLREHSRLLREHTSLLREHISLLREHSRLLREHSSLHKNGAHKPSPGAFKTPPGALKSP
ncbi:hypothetical protein LWI29_006353 [Acer saccharum]|uniref:RNase H type-1 domain-containing protein n=1 Tax=Acer saccharum TaxID=4024 RepID=A0AA39RGF6_ACESA|nr:hypothetical protein LWI29_006353 [Acer saccharum]